MSLEAAPSVTPSASPLVVAVGVIVFIPRDLGHGREASGHVLVAHVVGRRQQRKHRSVDIVAATRVGRHRRDLAPVVGRLHHTRVLLLLA